MWTSHERRLNPVVPGKGLEGQKKDLNNKQVTKCYLS